MFLNIFYPYIIFLMFKKNLDVLEYIVLLYYSIQINDYFKLFTQYNNLQYVILIAL